MLENEELFESEITIIPSSDLNDDARILVNERKFEVVRTHSIESKKLRPYDRIRDKETGKILTIREKKDRGQYLDLFFIDRKFPWVITQETFIQKVRVKRQFN